MPRGEQAELAEHYPSARAEVHPTDLAAPGAVAAAGPWIVEDAFSSSGELNAIVWTNYLTKEFLQGFTKKTGIKVNMTPLGSNEELLNKLKASKGRGFDLITPTLNRKGQWQPLNLTQPWDLKKIPNLSNVEDAFVKASQAWTWGGGQHREHHGDHGVGSSRPRPTTITCYCHVSLLSFMCI